MSNKAPPANTNLKVCTRIRPIEYQSNMIQIDNEKSLTLKDTTNKTNIDKQLFECNKIWDAYVSQDILFQYVCKQTIGKAINGENACIISYGQTGAGKTYTIFGEDEKYTVNPINFYSEMKKDKRGLIPKTVQYLWQKGKDFENHRNWELHVSFAEIYMDQVRDLGKLYVPGENAGTFKTQGSSPSKKNSLFAMNQIAETEHENLEINELPNGQMAIKDLTIAQVKTMEELYAFITACFNLREKLEASKGNQL
jgi:hypothetical protein